MKKISDPKRIAQCLRTTGLQDQFDTPDLPFLLFSYEKHELIASPMARLEYLLFVVSGDVHIFGLHRDGGAFPVNIASKGMILGNCEFFSGESTVFYVEAKTDVLCLALSIAETKPVLDHDVRFLHAIIRSFFHTHRLLADVDLPAQSVEDRLLLYLKNIAPDHALESISSGTVHLHCSRRQLQRVVQKLCVRGVLRKTGKGRYCLAEHCA